MCNPASFVLTKDKVFWSLNSDSHEQIIKENDLVEGNAVRVNILRVEIRPPNGDFNAPLQDWVFRVDQSIDPEWHDQKKDEERARAELEVWFKARVILNEIRRVASGSFYACGSSQVKACDSSQVKACDSSQVTACDSSKVKACDSSQVKAYGSSQVTACDSSQVTACDSSKVEACDSSQVKACDSSQVKAYGSSQVTACGSSKVEAYDSSQVTACEDRSTTTRWNESSKVSKPTGKLALVIDRTGDVLKVFEGK